MKSLRAFFWGSVVGALLGYLLAPRRSDMLRADQETTRDKAMGKTTSAAG